MSATNIGELRLEPELGRGSDKRVLTALTA
jgi:hypothetical protein